MFIVLLKFSDNKDQAKIHMEGHNAWLQRGFAEDVFLCAGTIKPGLGGAILAHKAAFSEVQQRVNQDPFVIANVVKAEILEITPSRLDERLGFLGAGAS